MILSHCNLQPIHDYFCLTYSNFIVLHRSILQSMPVKWQQRMVRLLNQADSAVDKAGVETAPSYSLQARDDRGRFIADPVPHYGRGRTRLPLGGPR